MEQETGLSQKEMGVGEEDEGEEKPKEQSVASETPDSGDPAEGGTSTADNGGGESSDPNPQGAALEQARKNVAKAPSIPASSSGSGGGEGLLKAAGEAGKAFAGPEGIDILSSVTGPPK